MSWVEEAIATWKEAGIKLRPGASPERIAQVETLLGFQFPEDFVALYLEMDGFVDFDWDDELISVWSLDRMVKEYIEDKDVNYIGFCDYCINCYSFGFLKIEAGIFCSADQTKSSAENFSAFVRLMLLCSALV